MSDFNPQAMVGVGGVRTVVEGALQSSVLVSNLSSPVDQLCDFRCLTLSC